MTNIAVGLITKTDLSDLEHMRSYQRNIKKLFKLNRFAFVDSGRLVYTADEGIQDDIGAYDIDLTTIDSPVITVKNLASREKKVVIAVPIRDRGLSIEGKQLVTCFMEIDMEVMLKGLSMSPQGNGLTFCNLYTSNDVALTNTVLGGLAVEDNLLEVLAKAEYEPGCS